jgi:hypothetical protein
MPSRSVCYFAEGAPGDDDFEKRLATLKAAKKQTPYGESRKDKVTNDGRNPGT